jgi:hypothetical protein
MGELGTNGRTLSQRKKQFGTNRRAWSERKNLECMEELGMNGRSNLK